MKGEDVRRMQEPSEVAPEPSPVITPQMIRSTLKALEGRGIIYYAGGGAYVPTESGWKLLTEIKAVKEEILARGHPKVDATNQSIIVITRAADVKKDPDAVVAVGADKACKDLKKEFRDALKGAKKVQITIEAEGESDVIIAFGSPALKLTNQEEIIIRKDSFIDSRTVAILADKSANELRQELVEKLRNPEAKVKITLEIKP